MRFISIVISLMLAINLGCKKDTIITNLPPESPATNQPEGPISMLVIDTVGNSKVTVKKFSPPLSFSTHYSYNIDVDADSISDFMIVNTTSWACGGIDPHTWVRVRTLNESSFVLCDSIFQINYYTVSPHAFDHSVNYDSLHVKALKLHDTIRIGDKFRSGSIFLRESHRSWCGIGAGLEWGDHIWANMPDSAIGIRYKDRLGWIKIGSQKIYGFALSK